MSSIKPGSTELRHLRYFIAVAEFRNFRRAAAALNVSQPTLSHQIAQLELQIGATLFDRSRRDVRLTAPGQILLRSAHSMLRELGEAKRAIVELAELQGGQLRIGVLPSINVCLPPELIRQFVKRHPKISLSLTEHGTDEISAQLLSGKIHLGLGYYPSPDRAIEANVFAEERLIGVVAPGHRFAGNKQVAFNEFAQGPIVLLSRGPATRENWRDGSPSSIIEMASVEDALNTVRQSGSAAILPVHAVCRDRHGDLTQIILRGFPYANRKIAFLQPRNACRCHAASAFIELARRLRYECFPVESRLLIEPQRSTPT
jgi:LysR family transcriptional regulator, cyn operon transcriptional activator